MGDGGTRAVALDGILKARRGESVAEKVKAELRRAGVSPGESVLLYGMEKFSGSNAISAARAAIESGCGGLKIELPVPKEGGAELVRALFDVGVKEIFLVLNEGSGGETEKRTGGPVVEIFRAAAEECAAGRLKARMAVATVAETQRLLETVLGGGVRHVVMDAGGAEEGAVAGMHKVCRRESENRDALLEVLRGERKTAFRGRSFRRADAERMFLDVPSYELGSRRVPLCVVFQLGFACNQRCVFCTSDRTLPAVSAAVKKKKMEYALGLGAPRVVFTGGEPTLDPDLPGMAEKFAAAGVPEISVYTNGMAFAARGYAARLAGAGVNCALVSLHSARPEVADGITGRPGGFAKTVRGIKELLKVDICVAVNFVINGMNYREAPGFAAFAARNLPGAALNFSCVAPVSGAVERTDLVPRFSDAVPYLVEALAACEEAGIDYAGLEPHWGVPPCALGSSRLRYMPLQAPLAGPYSGFVKGASCGECAIDNCCPGVREKYARMYGTGELAPLRG